MGKLQAPRKQFYYEEVQKLLEQTLKEKNLQNRVKYHLMIKMAFRHALRIGEVIDLKWSDFDFDEKKYYVRRLKNGSNMPHILSDDEIEDLLLIKHMYRHHKLNAEYVFLNGNLRPYSPCCVSDMLARIARDAGFNYRPNFHMLRHGCGYYLTNVKEKDFRLIQEYLGHKDMQNTVIYTQIDGGRLAGIMD